MSAPVILLADDDEVGRYVIAETLRRAGFQVREAVDGPGTIAEAVRLPPDVVVLDVKMPGLDGFEVCAALKLDMRTAHVPVLLLSATFLETEYQVQGLNSGADGYLTQPVEGPVLVATLRALLRAREAEQQVRLAAQQWRTTFDAISDGVCVLSVDNTIMRLNTAFAEIVEQDAEALVGAALAHVLPEVAASLRDSATEEVEVVLGARIVRPRLDLFIDPERHEPQSVLTLTDMTALREAERQRTAALERDRAVSRLLQRSLLPDHLPQRRDLALAARHVAAGEGDLVGGDWYEAIELGDEVWVVLGDVAGHGVETAAKANELRHTLRVYAREGYGPVATLRRLNELVLADDLVGLATAALVRVREGSEITEIILAGHPPPVAIRDGKAEIAEGGRGPVLGVPGADWTPARLTLPAGARLILYTDGLIERPHESLDRGLERLLEATAGLPGAADAALDHLLAELPAEGERRDDVAVLLLDRLA